MRKILFQKRKIRGILLTNMPKKRKIIDSALIARIEACIAENRLNPTQFGKSAVGDHRLLATLKTGRELRRDTRARVEAFLAEPSSNQRAS